MQNWKFFNIIPSAEDNNIPIADYQSVYHWRLVAMFSLSSMVSECQPGSFFQSKVGLSITRTIQAGKNKKIPDRNNLQWHTIADSIWLTESFDFSAFLVARWFPSGLTPRYYRRSKREVDRSGIPNSNHLNWKGLHVYWERKLSNCRLILTLLNYYSSGKYRWLNLSMP